MKMLKEINWKQREIELFSKQTNNLNRRVKKYLSKLAIWIGEDYEILIVKKNERQQ